MKVKPMGNLMIDKDLNYRSNNAKEYEVGRNSGDDFAFDT
jgi:hypothetical protein